MTETITITFGDVAENHVGMEKLGKKRHHGFLIEDLEYTKIDLEEMGYEVQLIDLVAESKIDTSLLEPAAILVIKNGVNLFTQADLWKELSGLDWDKKMFNSRRKVVQQKIARHNLCFADISTSPKYEEGRGRVYNFKDLPGLKEIRENLPEIFGYTGCNLVAEGNRYYDVKKCGIGFHGDSERKVVIGVRLGADFPLEYQWRHRSLPIGERIKIELGDQDVYVMSEKAVGSDWMKSSLYTLRHAAGFHKRFIKPILHLNAKETKNITSTTNIKDTFLDEHLKIITPFAKEIKKYKDSGFRNINSYYRNKGVGSVAVKNTAKKLESIYELLVPLDHDIIVYRGIKTGFLGNTLDGKYVRSDKYDLITPENFEYLKHDKIPLEKIVSPCLDPPFEMETIGFASYSTEFSIAKQFASISSGNYDTVVALKLPAGVKFLMPINPYHKDIEQEVILFPGHNSFILDRKSVVDGCSVYWGTVLN